jgi:hypothetical protein
MEKAEQRQCKKATLSAMPVPLIDGLIDRSTLSKMPLNEYASALVVRFRIIPPRAKKWSAALVDWLVGWFRMNEHAETGRSFHTARKKSQ